MCKFVIAKQLLQLSVKVIKVEFRGGIWLTYKSACLFDVLAQNLCHTHTKVNHKITIFFRDYLKGRLKLTVELIDLSVSHGQGLKNSYDSNLSYLIFDVLLTACFKGSSSHLLTEVMF